MAVVATLKGIGSLLVGEGRILEADYWMEILRRGDDELVARGRLTAGAADLAAAQSAPACTLRLNNGREVQIAIVKLDGAKAVFRASGALPYP